MGITIRRAVIAALGAAALAPAAAPAADGVLGPAFPANVRANAAVASDGSTRVAWFTGKPGLGTEAVATCAIAPGRSLCSVPAKIITLTSSQVSRVGVGPVPFILGPGNLA